MNTDVTTRDAGPGGRPGPSLAAIPIWDSAHGRRISLLNDDEQSRLSVIASIARFKKRERIYEEAGPAEYVYIIISGVVKTYRTVAEGDKRIAAFLFPDDAFGLAEEGKHLNSAEAVTPVVAYRLPVAALRVKLRSDPELEFQVICKLCHELREAQRHAFLLGRPDALGRVALFLQMMAHYQAARRESPTEISLPMTRSDIADYIGMSFEAVSRSLRTLARRGVIGLRDRRHLRLLDPARLEALISGLRRPARDEDLLAGR